MFSNAMEDLVGCHDPFGAESPLGVVECPAHDGNESVRPERFQLGKNLQQVLCPNWLNDQAIAVAMNENAVPR